MARTAVKRQQRRATVPIADQRRASSGTKASRISIPPVALKAPDESRTQHTTVLPDIRPPVEPERQKPSYEDRMYSGPKVARILGNYSIDMNEFVEFYDKLPRRLDLWKEPTEYEVAAMEAFLQHQDLAELCKDLDLTQQSAFKVITRYLIWAYGQDGEEEDEQEEVEEENGVLNGSSVNHDDGVVVQA